jgi:hypothetical protein
LGGRSALVIFDLLATLFYREKGLKQGLISFWPGKAEPFS